MFDKAITGITDAFVHLQHPFKILRRFMKGHPDLKQASTQKGFAELVDCSQSLIRAVEQGQTHLTPKLEKKIQAATGVSIAWLSTQHLPDQPIPAASGGALTHEAVITRIKDHIERYQQQAERSLMAVSKTTADSSSTAMDPSSSIKRRMAASIGKLVEEALFESLSRGENRLMDEITRALSRDLPAEKTNSGKRGEDV
ncbi:MAG: helix-turn-helix domain-containing protein [Luteolibacter sp.]